MSELHKFIFEGLPVRGMVVRLTDAWAEILQRRANNPKTGAYPLPVQSLLGELTAAAVLLQANIRFDGALVLQIVGDGPLKLIVAEVQSDLGVRATASLYGKVSPQDGLSQLVNLHGQGRCAITLDPSKRLPGQQPYQGVVSLHDESHRPLTQLSAVIQHYMLQSEQLETTLVLAANEAVAAGLLIQRLPTEGLNNLQGQSPRQQEELDEHYRRISLLAASLTQQELLSLDVDTLLHRLFWEEPLQRFQAQAGERPPRFLCRCSRDRVAQMIRSLGEPEALDIVQEQGQVEVDCEFCGAQYRFDAIEAAQLFRAADAQPPASGAVQ